MKSKNLVINLYSLNKGFEIIFHCSNDANSDVQTVLVINRLHHLQDKYEGRNKKSSKEGFS